MLVAVVVVGSVWWNTDNIKRRSKIANQQLAVKK